MSKTVTFTAKPKPAQPPATADAWVQQNGEAAAVAALAEVAVAKSEPMKRFTIDVSEELHKRIKAQCAQRGSKMADVIRDLLEREFPRS